MIIKKVMAFVAATALAMGMVSNTNAAVTDGAFSINQIFDVQYNWSGTTLNASNFIAPYDSNFQTVTATAGQYFKFIDNGDGTHGMGLYNSDNTLNRVIHSTGQITALGSGAIFYLGSGWLGNVISTAEGYNYGASASFTNMDTSVSAGDISSYTWASTTPLAAGQTAGSTGTTPTYTAITSANVVQVTPTSNNSPSGEGATNVIDGNSGTKYLNFDRASAGFTIKLDQGRVLEKLTITTANDYAPRDPSKFSLFGSNDGKTWTTIVDNQAITLSDSRFTASSDITFTNTNAYVYYFITFDSTKALDLYPNMTNCMAAYGGGWLGTENCNSVQVSEVSYYYNSASTTTSTDTGDGTVANPGTSGATSSLNTTPTVVSTAPGTSQVVTTETPGTTVTSATIVRGNTVEVVTHANNRGDATADNKQLAVVRTTTVVSTTPVTTTTTQTTPVTVTTVTTPRTVTTWSDGTTTTADGTPVTTVTVRNDITTTVTTTNEVVTTSSNQNYYTRIDQYSQLEAANNRMNMNLDSDVLSRHTSTGEGLTSRTRNAGSQEKGWWYLVTEGGTTNTNDTYSLTNRRLGVGHEKQIKGNWVVGLQYNHVRGTLSGQDAGGSLTKDHVGIYSLYNHNNWLFKTDVGYAQNSFTNYHLLPELGYSNSGKTTGADAWISNRLYTPDWRGFRPFGGIRVEQNKRNALIESGDAITAMSYNSVNRTRTVSELGLRYDTVIKDAVNFMLEASHTDTNLSTVRAGINFAPRQNIVGGITVGQQYQNGVSHSTAQASIRWVFN
jgi:hypothetical protein